MAPEASSFVSQGEDSGRVGGPVGRSRFKKSDQAYAARLLGNPSLVQISSSVVKSSSRRTTKMERNKII